MPVVGVIVVVAWKTDGVTKDGEGTEVVAEGTKMGIPLQTRATIINMTLTEVE